jgi:glycosyltransferase involved in cell wall biosynthesis
MRLSVVIPCFNAANTIASQLEALASQQWSEPWEVIISDNGSTDNSVAIAQQYRERLPHLRIVDASKQRGAAHAKNVGAIAATGEALAFCDADDEVAPGWVAAMGEALAQYDLVACCREYQKLNEPWALQYRALTQQEQVQDYQYPPYLPHASGSTLGVKRSLYLAVGGFDESIPILDDTDFCWKLQLQGTQLQFVPEAVIHYRFRHTLNGIYQQAKGYGTSNILLYKKYRPLGMPPLSWHSSFKPWLRLLKSFPQISSLEGRAKWVWALGWRMGRLQGSIKHQVWAL